MECPKCGYERQPEETSCQMCGVDFGLLERQENEKKILREKLKKQASLSPSKSSDETTKSGLVLEEEKAAAGDCPKCGFPRKEGDIECPQCGVIYKKHEEILERQKAEEEKKKKEEQRRFEEEKARVQEEAKRGIQEARAKRKAENKIKKKEKVDLPGKSVVKDAAKKITDKVMPLLKNPKRIVAVFLVVIAIGFLSWGGYSLVTHWQKASQQRELVKKKKAAREREKKRRKEIVKKFTAEKDEILKKLKRLIDKRKFASFENEIKAFEIPQLEEDLKDIKEYQKEIKLVDKTKWIPGGDYEKNYKAYKTLWRMDPKNKIYSKKLKYYRQKFAERKFIQARKFFRKKSRYRSDIKKALADIGKAIELEGLKKKYGKLRYHLKTEELLFFEGNDRVKMAVRNDGLTKGATGGQRKIYVWVKNVGKSSFYVNVDYFKLLCKNNKTYSYNDCSRALVTILKPGQETHGYLYFYTSSSPRVLKFSHITAGSISRKFP